MLGGGKPEIDEFMNQLMQDQHIKGQAEVHKEQHDTLDAAMAHYFPVAEVYALL